jgi:hypothetical protein
MGDAEMSEEKEPGTAGEIEPGQGERDQHHDYSSVFERMRRRAADAKFGPFNWEQRKADRDAGRP